MTGDDKTRLSVFAVIGSHVGLRVGKIEVMLLADEARELAEALMRASRGARPQPVPAAVTQKVRPN